MPFSSRLLVSLCATAGLLSTAFAQEAPIKGKQLTARELFYAAVQVPREEPKTEPSPKTVRPKTVPKAKPPESAPDGGQTLGPAAATPLGLRYTVLKFSGNTPTEVTPDTVFRAGDRVQLVVEANNAGYLYIVSQGSSGSWKPIFPSPEVENGDNHVESLHPYTLPSEKHRMVFDETVGAEKLFIILSRQPESDLDKMIYSLQGKPASAPKQLVAGQNPQIDDATVGRMRKAYARDLIIERVTPETPGEKKETAVYVVNPTGSYSSRVVADLTLAHR